jgi:hypothetical protein
MRGHKRVRPARDRDLGMDRTITRRDFLNGVSLALTGALFGSMTRPAEGAPKEGAAFNPEQDSRCLPLPRPGRAALPG